MLQNNIILEGKTVLITGVAGFIGSNLAQRLFHDVRHITVIGIDSITDYYDVSIKHQRLVDLETAPVNDDTHRQQWVFVQGDIADRQLVDQLFADYRPHVVVNLAAQAGVRYSITHPDAYIQSNLIGFYNLLEACRHSIEEARQTDDDRHIPPLSKPAAPTAPLHSTHGVEHFVYASSSSDYGSNTKVLDSIDDKVKVGRQDLL